MKTRREISHNKNERRRRIVLFNISFTYAGYLLSLCITLLAVHLGYTSMPVSVIPWIFIPAFIAPLPFIVIILKQKYITESFVTRIFLYKFILWTTLYSVWVYHLREARVISMFLAFTALVYFMSMMNLRKTITAMTSIITIQVFISWFATAIMNEAGSLHRDLFYTAAFIPALIFISYMSGQYYRQRQNLKHAKDMVKEQAEEINAAMEEVEAINENLSEANRELSTAQRIARMDIDMAVNVQKNFLPQDSPATRNWETAFYFQPMSDVSGDFYDFYESDNDLTGVGIFDVSGHGIASGLVTMIAKSIIFREFSDGRDRHLGQIMSDINEGLVLEIGAVDNFITGLLLRMTGNKIEYLSAGHPDIFVKTKKKVYIPRPGKDQPFGGALLGMPVLMGPYFPMKFTIEPGDYIFLYTDCLLENKNSNDEHYGSVRLMNALMKAECNTSRELLDSVLDNFLEFSGTEGLLDDLTIVVLRYNPQ